MQVEADRPRTDVLLTGAQALGGETAEAEA